MHPFFIFLMGLAAGTLFGPHLRALLMGLRPAAPAAAK